MTSPTSPAPIKLSRPAVRLRFAVWQVLIVLHLLAAVGTCLLLAGPDLLRYLRWLMGAWLLLGVGTLAFWALLITTPPDAIRTSPAAGVRLVVLGAVVLQAAAVACLAPVLSDDVVRYRLDGRAWVHGYSPYAHSPADLELATASGSRWFDSVDRAIAHPSIATIYLPSSQLVFIPLANMEPAVHLPQPSERDWRQLAPGLPWPARVPVFKLVFGLLAVVGTWLLCRILVHADQSPWWALLFGWNPLLMIEAGGMAHQDVLGVVFLLAAVLAHVHQRPAWAGLALAAAVMVKPIALVLLPFWLRQQTPSRRTLLVAFAVAVGLLLLPLLHQQGYSRLAATMGTYLGTWEANGLYHRALEPVITGWLGFHRDTFEPVSRGTALVILAAVFAVLWRRRVAAVPAAYALMLTSLLVAPVVYAWYLLWPLALAPLVPRGGLVVLVWSGTIALSYQLLAEPVWRLPWPVLLAEYVPVAAALVAVALAARAIRPPQASASSVAIASGNASATSAASTLREP